MQFQSVSPAIFASSMGYSREILDSQSSAFVDGFTIASLCPEVEAVKRGVLFQCAHQFPTISLGGVPTSLKFRNLMSMDVEEMIRAQPMDAVVLVALRQDGPCTADGCASPICRRYNLLPDHVDEPYRGERLGACTDYRFSGPLPGRRLSESEIGSVGGGSPLLQALVQ